MRTSSKKKAIKISIIIGASLGAFCIILIAALFFWIMGGIPTRYTSIKEYDKQWENFEEGDLLIFPRKISNFQDAQYFFLLRDTFLNPTVEIYLKCPYNETEYLSEKQRLQNIALTWKNETQSTRLDTERFSMPCYTAVYQTQKYEYALLDEENHTIIYICMRFIGNGKVHFPKEYLPKDYTNGDVEYADRHDIYNFHGYMAYQTD